MTSRGPKAKLWWDPRTWASREASFSDPHDSNQSERTDVDKFASTILVEPEHSSNPQDQDSTYIENKKRIVISISEAEQSLLSLGIDVFSRSGANLFDKTLSQVFPPSELARKQSRERQYSGRKILDRTEADLRRVKARGGKLALEEGLTLLNSTLSHPGERAILELFTSCVKRRYYHVFYRGKNGLNTTRPFGQLAMIAFQLPDDVVLLSIEDATLRTWPR